MIIHDTVENVIKRLQDSNISFERSDISSQHTELKFSDSEFLKITNIDGNTLKIIASGSDELRNYLSIIKPE